MRIKWIMPAAATVLAVSLVATGCSKGTGDSAASKETVPANAAPVKLKITQEGSGVPSPEDDIIKKELDKKLGIDVDMSYTQGMTDYLNQLKVRVAAGDYPDMMLLDLTTLNDFSQKGLLLDLTPYLDSKLKQAKDFMGPSLLKKGVINGKNYAITRIADVPFGSYWIRKDWLDKLNLQIPQTLDDLMAVSRAFTENDPDGNGKKDTYAMTGNGMDFSAFSPIFGAYGVGLPGAFYVKDGKVVDSYHDASMKDALGYIQKLISSNYVDPQITTNKGTMGRDQAFQGKAGIVYSSWTDMGKQEFIQQYKTINPKAEWIQISPPKGPGGQFDGSFDSEKPSRLLAIPKTLEKQPEKLQKLFDLLNYVSTKEGNQLVMYGIQERDYKVENGKIVLTELMAKEGNYFHYYQFTGRPNEEYLKTKFPTEEPMIKFSLSLTRIKSFGSSVLPPAGHNAADAGRYANEELIKFLYSKRSLAEYPEFLKTLDDTFKYKLLQDEAQKRAKELELIK